MIRRRRGAKAPNYFVIGIAGIAVLAFTFYLSFTKRVPFTPRYEISAVMQSSSHLRTGSPVRIAGVDIGEVTGFARGPGTTRIVKMAIEDAGRPVHADATATIKPRLFLEGGFFVDLRPGTARARELPGGGTIPLGQTAIPVQLSQILSTLTKPARTSLQAVVKESAAALEGGGAEGLNAAAPALPPLVSDIAQVSEALAGDGEGDVATLVGQGAKAARALASRDRELAELIANLNTTAAALAAEDSALGATVRELDATLRGAPAPLAALDRSLPPARAFLAALRPALPGAPRTLRRTSELLRQLLLITRPAELPRFLARLRPALEDFGPLQKSLGALMPLVREVSKCTADKALPVLRAKLDDGHLSSGRAVWQDLTNAMVGLASANQDFDANGPWIRYMAGLGDRTASIGRTPGGDELFGSIAGDILGSRPKWLGSGVTPPFRPDASCLEQAAPDLGARR